ncbi:MAG TPA: TonB-dependent receptor, partial [Firmicutes bacterium]|nr:TonB-dependent receptor [Bacillota bacterium]
LLTLAFLFTSLTVFAGTTGALLGFITEEDGSPIGEATITVIERGASVVSNEYGMFSIPSLTPGVYTVEVKKAGYGPMKIEKVIIQVDLTTPLNVTLKTSEVELDPIVVTASRILVHREQTGTVYRVDHNDIVEMSSRDIFRVAQAMPGVISNEDGQFKIRGSRYDQTLFLIDGLTMMDPFWKTFGATPNAKGIMGEVAVITGGFDAEYGDAIGGVVNTVSRNPNFKEHRGSLTFYTSQIPNYHGMWDKSIKLGEEEWDVDMDGPLSPDLGYVFAAQVFKANASTTSGFRNENFEEFHDYHFKLSYNLNSTTNLSYHTNYGFAWIRLKSDYENSFPGWPIQFQFNRMHHVILDTYVGNYTTATLALGWFQSGIDFGPHAKDDEGNILWNEIKPLFEYDGDDAPYRQRTRSIAKEVKLDVETKMFDRHTLKAGLSHQNTFVDMFWTVTYDSYFFGSNETWPEFSYLEDWEHTYDYNAFYIQDKFDLIKDKLTLTAGIRYESWGFIPKENSVIAPRGGVSYQLNDYTIIRTNYSKMYQAPNVSSVYEEDTGGLQNYFGDQDWGNAEEVVPQVTDIIEFGVQRQLGNDFVFEVNAYNKTMDKIHCVWENPVTNLWEYTNGGSGWARGAEFTLRKTLSNNIKGWVNYSWMEGKGKNIYRDFYNYSNIGTEIWDKEYYLDWDQRHNVNVNLFYQSENFFMNVIWRWGSGYPYSPHDSYLDYGIDGIDSTTNPVPPDYGEGNGRYDEGEPTYSSDPVNTYNSARYPAYDRVDIIMKLKLKNLNLFGAEYWFNVTVRNLFDHHNLRQRGGNDPSDINPYTDEPWTLRPTGGTYRRVVAGIEANW